MKSFETQKAIAVANFVIKYAKSQERPVSNLQLQKILYFLQAYSLVELEKPLIEEKFSKWSYGPVIKEVYNTYSFYGSTRILQLSPKMLTGSDGFKYSAPSIMKREDFNDENTYDFLEKFTDFLIKKSPWDLVNITHAQPIWKNDEPLIKKHQASEYENEDIKNCFIENKGDQLWQELR